MIIEFGMIEKEFEREKWSFWCRRQNLHRSGSLDEVRNVFEHASLPKKARDLLT